MPRCDICGDKQLPFMLKDGMCKHCYDALGRASSHTTLGSLADNITDKGILARRAKNLRELGKQYKKENKNMTRVKTYVRAHATRMVENGILSITGANTLKMLGLLAPDGYTMTQKMHNMVVPRMTAPKYNEMEIQDFSGRFADEIRQVMEGGFWKQ